MSFNNLLLIFALAAVSFGKMKKNADPDKLRVYYDSGILNGTTLTFDVNEIVDFYPFPLKSALISDFNKFNTTAQVTDSDFIISPFFDEGHFFDSKTTDDIEDGCDAVQEVFDSLKYGLYGFAALALEGANIQPSITALIKNGPTLVTYKNVPDDEEIPDIPIELSCDGGAYHLTTYGLQKSGVVGTDCFPNTGIPQSTAACTKQGGKNEPKLKGYFEGHIFNADAATLKDALIRFGPVIVHIDDGEIHQGILLGWLTEGTQKYWIVAVPLGNGYMYSELNIDFETLDEVGVLLSPIQLECVKPAADTKKDVCPCPTDKESQRYKDDERTLPKGICASGSVRMTMGMIAAVVIIPVLALLF